jgi:hypothetical protein
VQAEQDREQRRIAFREYATDYLEWSKKHKRSWTTDRGMYTRLLPVFGDKKLDEITTADVERFRDSLLDEDVSRATANRYRDLLSGMFRRAIRLGTSSATRLRPSRSSRSRAGVSHTSRGNRRVLSARHCLPSYARCSSSA